MYRTSYRKTGSYKTGARKVTNMTAYNAMDVWSAAAAATRINNGYVKERETYYDWEKQTTIVNRESNKSIVLEMLKNNSGWAQEDIDEGQLARAHWQGNMIKILSGTANPFETSAIAVSNKDTIDNFYDIAVLSSLVASYRRAKTVERINELKGNSQFCGNIGEHFVAQGNVVSSHYSDNFGKYRNELITEEGNVFSWWGNKADVGSAIHIKGKVKAHHNERNGSKVTQLNYVKVIEE